jgi:hypothetical protein
MSNVLRRAFGSTTTDPLDPRRHEPYGRFNEAVRDLGHPDLQIWGDDNPTQSLGNVLKALTLLLEREAERSIRYD